MIPIITSGFSHYAFFAGGATLRMVERVYSSWKRSGDPQS